MLIHKKNKRKNESAAIEEVTQKERVGGIAKGEQKPAGIFILLLVWLLRITVGSIFIFSGFAKAVDPWGFYYKMGEYLQVWQIEWVWHQLLVCAVFVISCAEFTAGILLLMGSFRRWVCIFLLAMMAFMLPLTAYIAVFSPVADCGCFGDALKLSNTATFIKNIFITGALVLLLVNNKRVQGVCAPLVQWLTIVVSVVYCLFLSVVGYNVQPLVDFRNFKVGERLISGEGGDLKLIYERDGQQRAFSVDSLPDSTWTYLSRQAPEERHTHGEIAIYDGDEEVTESVISNDGPQMLLAITNPHRHTKARASMANNLNAFMEKNGGSMIGIVGTVPDSLETWVEKANPAYEVFTSDDTSLKELVRGDAGLVYLYDGEIKWKLNLYSLPGDFPDINSDLSQLDSVAGIDSGTQLKKYTLIYIASLVIICLLGRFRIEFKRNQEKTREC